MAHRVRKENISALEPLFKPWEEPTKHRKPNPKSGAPALIVEGRRPSKVPLVSILRKEVHEWRSGGYRDISETSRKLLRYWFGAEHWVKNERGELVPFRYHWAQREAIETFIYLYERCGIRTEAQLLTHFRDALQAEAVSNLPPAENRWAKYCAKIATGAGKTKIMSLAIVWSYFHKLREKNSDLAQHFVIIAPNLIVYDRLKADFEHGAIFRQDPLIPEEWKPDFQMQVVLQDEPGGLQTIGTIYLTNIHRLYPKGEQSHSPGQGQLDSIFGPPVVRERALDTGESLRTRITAHPRLMILNDEAHHLHDPDLAWNRALENLHDESIRRGHKGICLQLDFSATPKDSEGRFFRHIVVDFPLGEAVDAGIVKVPVIGSSKVLRVRGTKKDPAHKRYKIHLSLAYKRYKQTYKELHQVRKPILFVMTEDAQSADEIAKYLDSDAFPLLKGRVLNIHSRLKGKIIKVSRGGKTFKEFVESDDKMKPEDLQALREMSRELDSPDSKYRCVVSVMMLREGWDIRNVTTIVPLRPYSAKSDILPEQTLGRGLRRMFPSGDIPEVVTVIEHPSFQRLYEQELAQEGLNLFVPPIWTTLKQTVTIFVDSESKNVKKLEIEIPIVSESIKYKQDLNLSFQDVENYLKEIKFSPLPIRHKRDDSIKYYEEQHLFTKESIEKMQLGSRLLDKAWYAPSYFAQVLGRACGLSNPHQVLAPLLERFICEVLFEKKVNLYNSDLDLDRRMQDSDVQDYIYAVFAPLIRKKIKESKGEERRLVTHEQQLLSNWKPYQATSHPKRPAISAERTMFNLVPCDNDFERQFVTKFLEIADDVAAFAKNAGPQKLMIDYLRPDGLTAFYIPDFFVRTTKGDYYLVELKGRQDNLVPLKAKAAMEWCRVASTVGKPWKYLYVPQDRFQKEPPATIEELARICKLALQELFVQGK